MTPDSSTIAALLTPLAPGAIAVVGLAGPRTDEILDRVLRRGKKGGPVQLADNRPTFCRLVDGSEVIDDVIAVRIPHPDKPAAEINTHGGTRIAQRTLLLLEQNGAAIVDAGTFTGRFHAGNPAERDVDQALLEVSSRRLARWLLSQRRILPAFLAGLGAVGSDEQAAFRERSRAAIRLLGGLHVALIGPPNAGKSTLANRLIGTDRVITSPEPGTTRDWVSETALVGGWPVTLTDTAGIHLTTCVVEAEAVRRARRQAEQADLVVVVLDATAPSAVTRQLRTEFLGGLPAGQAQLTVINKCDLVEGQHGTGGGAEGILRISALTGAGIDLLEARLIAALGLDLLDDRLPTAFLPRQLS